MPSGKGKLTKKHGDVIRLRLAGKSYSQIAARGGYSRNAVIGLFNKANPFLSARTLKRIAIASPKSGPSKASSRMGVRLPSSVLQRTRDIFFEELGNGVFKGSLKKAAKRLHVHSRTVMRRLAMAGISTAAEHQRCRLNFALKVQRTMHLPLSQAARLLESTPRSINNYRKLVRQGKHLQGAIVPVPRAELVQNPGEWHSVSSNARINLALRNRAVEERLALFDKLIVAARKKMVAHHPDKPRTSASKFQKAFQRREQLRRAKQRFIEQETRFRKSYDLPLHHLLKK